MAFWGRMTQYKLRQLTHHSKTVPFAALINPSAKACVSDSPSFLIPHTLPTDFSTKVRFFAAPVQANSKKVEQSTKGPRMNEKIMAEVVRLVVDEEHFIISRREALERAKKLQLDLVEVQGTANPPVCKIMDYHKEKYKKEIREKEQIKVKSDKTLRADSKEVKFSPKTEAKDLKMKADMVKRFMDKGYRVKCTATDADGKDLDSLFARLTVLIEDVALIECEPTPGRGKEAYIIVRHMKFGPSKKGAGKKSKTGETTPEAQKKGSDNETDVTSHVADSPRDSDSNRLHVTPTRPHTVPPPPRDDGTPNRYRSNEPRNPFPPTRGVDNRGPGMRDPHIPYQRSGQPTNVQFSPSMRDPRQAETNAPVFRNSRPPPPNVQFSPSMRDPRQAETNASGFRNSTPPPPNVQFSPSTNPRQAETNAPGFRNSTAPPPPPPHDIPKQEHSSPSASRTTPGLGFGIFSNPKDNPPPRHHVPDRVPPNSKPDSNQPGGFGIFGRDSPSENPNRISKP